MKKLAVLLAIALASCASQGEYPSKDIQLVVNAQAGSGTDAINRQIAKLVETELKGEFYVVNKPDAVDATGPNTVMNAKADGYTIGNLNYGSVVNAVWEEAISGYSMDKLNLFAMVSQESDALMVGKNSPYKTFNDLIEAARQNPGKIRIGDQGIGSRVYLLTVRLEQSFGVSFNKISYKSSAAQREAILNNEIDAAITSLGDFSSLLNSGDSVGLIEFSTLQNKTYPTVPTAIAAGLGADFISGSFIIMGAPADTPKEIITKLEDAFEKAVNSKEFVDWTIATGITAQFMKGSELQTFVKNLQVQEFKYLDELKSQNILK